MIKLIATDLDGTLVDELMQISELNMQAIMKAKNKGIEVVVATGRNITEIPQQLFDSGIRYFITSNGAHILDNKTGDVIAKHYLSVADAQSALKIACEYNVLTTMYIENDKYSDNRFDCVPPNMISKHITIEQYIREQYNVVDDLNDKLTNDIEGVQKIVVLCGNSQDQLSLSKKLIGTKLFEISSSFANSIEINPKNVHKALAIKKLCDRLNITTDELATIGDSGNDIMMLKMTHHSYAVANATAPAKESASFSVSSCQENGFAEMVDKILHL